MASAWRRDLLSDGMSTDAVASQIGHAAARVSEAPAVVIVSLHAGVGDAYPDERRQLAERIMATQAIGAFVQSFLLAAHARGLGSCWMCAPLFCQTAVAAFLDLPASLEPQALLTVGYPLAPGRPRTRCDIDDLLVEPGSAWSG